jgi:hypothetical protein
VIFRWDEEISDKVTLRVTPSLGLDKTIFGVGQAFTFEGGGMIGQLRAEVLIEPTEAVSITPGLDFQGGTWSFKFRAPLRLEDLDDPLSERDPVGFNGNGNAWYPDPWLRMDLRPLKDRDRLILTPSIRFNTTRTFKNPRPCISARNSCDSVSGSSSQSVTFRMVVTFGSRRAASIPRLCSPMGPREIIRPIAPGARNRL